MKYKVFSIAFFFKWFPRKLFSFEISGWGNKLDVLNFCVLIISEENIQVRKYFMGLLICSIPYSCHCTFVGSRCKLFKSRFDCSSKLHNYDYSDTVKALSGPLRGKLLCWGSFLGNLDTVDSLYIYLFYRAVQNYTYQEV